MEENEGRVQEKGGQNGRNILRINTFYEPSPLLSFHFHLSQKHLECRIFGQSTILEALIIFT